jgi:hypothetical protein
MPGWGAYLSLAFLLLGAFAAFYPGWMPWVYVAAVLAFELWLLRRIAAVGSAPVPAMEEPYRFAAEEAALVGRFRFYFTYPEIARNAASALAALGLSAIVLAPWLTYRQALLPAVLIGLNLFAVARMTKLMAPLLGLRIAASKGDREALRMLEAHDPAWAKIRATNERGE